MKTATEELAFCSSTYIERHPEIADDAGALYQVVEALENDIKPIDARRRELDDLGAFDHARPQVGERARAGLAALVEQVLPPAERTARAALAKVAEKNAFHADQITRAENNALTLRPSPDGHGFVQVRPDRARTAEELARETWIWSELRRMAPADAQMFYRQAIVDRDHDLIEHIERMPKAFSPITDTHLALGRKMRLESSPHFASIKAMRDVLAARQSVADKATRLVDDLIGSVRTLSAQLSDNERGRALREVTRQSEADRDRRTALMRA